MVVWCLGGCGLVFRWLGWCFGGRIGVWVSFFVIVVVGGCWGACGGGVIFWVCDFWILILCS